MATPNTKRIQVDVALKNAYQYAKDGGYTGTEEEFAKKMASETSSIHVGTDAPTNDSNVWIDTDEEAGEGTSSGSASIDVTAEVGQTIVVDEVDASGKPTKWRSADYQPRTHWSEETVILPETTVEIDPEVGVAIFPDMPISAGDELTVIYNGSRHVCICDDLGDGMWALGNYGLLVDPDNPVDTGEPFVIARVINADENGNEIYEWGLIPVDGSTTITLTIAKEKYHTIPREYVPKPYYVYDITMDQFESFNSAYKATPSEIPVALLEAMHLRMPIYIRIIDTSFALTKEYMASATWWCAGIDALWAAADKTLETIPSSGFGFFMSIGATIFYNANAFADFFIVPKTTD